MFLTSKTVWTGIVFTWMTVGLCGAMLAAGPELSKEDPSVSHQNEVKKLQQILYDKGHYRGRVDGVFGLRTRASIRAFQKAESLPVTGRLDTQTAGKLGVRAPEAIAVVAHGSGQHIAQAHNQTGPGIASGKPSAGTQRTKDSGRSSRTRTKVLKPVADREKAQSGREK